MKEFITTNEPVNGVQKRPYTAPTLRIAEFAVETGFEGSSTIQVDGFSKQAMENDLMLWQMQNTNGFARNWEAGFGEAQGSGDPMGNSFGDGFWQY